MKQFSLALLIQPETVSLQEVTVSSDVMIKQFSFALLIQPETAVSMKSLSTVMS
jgi:hypothetical protein